MLLLLAITFVEPASAGSFTSTKAIVQTAGVSCPKKGMVQITDTMITVECKRNGYARNLADLHDLSWSVARGLGTMTARETSGDQFVVSVKKREFEALKQALLSNLSESPAPKADKSEEG